MSKNYKKKNINKPSGTALEKWRRVAPRATAAAVRGFTRRLR